MSRALVRVAPPLAALCLTSCFRTDLPSVDTTTWPFEPLVGAPEGWVVEGRELELQCPDGEAARYAWVYPESAAAPPGQQRELLPLVILFHSGAFDYVFQPDAAAPTDGPSFQESQDEEKRLTAAWAEERIWTTLGMFPNEDGLEVHTGALPAALAAKGFAMLIPGNCWGDWWRNRSSTTAQNVFEGDFFFRDGHTAAEFIWLHAQGAFPPGNPVPRPVGIDTSRIYLVGLGEGGRAVTELINLRETKADGSAGAFLYAPAGVVLDSPIDDVRVYLDSANDLYRTIQPGLLRVWPSREVMANGTLAFTPLFGIPARTAILASSNDSAIPPLANDKAYAQLAKKPQADVWFHDGGEVAHVLSNQDVTLAKAVADYLAEGKTAVPPELVQTLPGGQ